MKNHFDFKEEGDDSNVNKNDNNNNKSNDHDISIDFNNNDNDNNNKNNNNNIINNNNISDNNSNTNTDDDNKIHKLETTPIKGSNHINKSIKLGSFRIKNKNNNESLDTENNDNFSNSINNNNNNNNSNQINESMPLPKMNISQIDHQRSLRIGEDLLSIEAVDPSQPNEKETIVDNTINKSGITAYNLRVYAVIALFFIADGGEMIIISLLVERLGDIWQLSNFQKGFMGAIVFVGFFGGALMSGKLADTRGRKPTFMLGAVIVASFAIISSFSPNYLFLITCRTFSGFGIGLAVPSATALATEVTPTHMRAWILNLIWIFFPIGEIVIVIIAQQIIYEYDIGWRILLVCCGVPSIANISISFIIEESPRFYIATKQYEKAFVSLDKIREFAKREPLTKEQKEQIKYETEQKEKEEKEKEEKERQKDIEKNGNNKDNSDDNKEKEGGFKVLLEKEYFYLTVIVCSIFFIGSFVYYGLVYILPQSIKANNQNKLINMNNKMNMNMNTMNTNTEYNVMHNDTIKDLIDYNQNLQNITNIKNPKETQVGYNAVNNTNINETIIPNTDPNKEVLDKDAINQMFQGILYSAISEIPAPFAASILSNMQIFGRKRSMALGFICTAACAFISACFLDSINFWASLFKFFIGISFGLIYVYTCEAYPTKVRSMAVGVSNAFTRIAGIITPLATQLLFSFGTSIPYFFFFILSVIGGVLSLALPFETYGRKTS